MSTTHTAVFENAILKSTELKADTKIAVGLDTEQTTKELTVVGDAPEIRIQDKTGSNPEVNQTTLSIVADGGVTHFRAGTSTFDTTETKGDIKFQSSTGDSTHAIITGTGRIGVGTTAPTESLDIVGNINLQKVSNTATIKLDSNVVTEYARSKKLIKYPRVALTSASQDGYVVTSSGDLNSSYPKHEAFNGVYDKGYTGISEGWISTTFSTSTFTGAPSGSQNGAWLGIQLPVKIKLQRVYMDQRYASAGQEYNKDTVIYASNDGNTWDNILEFDSSSSELFTAFVNASTYYNRYVFHVTSVNHPYGYACFNELELYGIPEYDPEAHGTDVVMRSVPNVPNTDWLEVYWDGRDYTSMPATVTDKSGNGATGTPSGGVGFDTEYKAFTFDGVDDYLTSPNAGNGTGEWIHSSSVWFKRSSDTSQYAEAIWHLGTKSAGQASSLITIGDELALDIWSTRVRVVDFVRNDQWYHVCGVYRGGSWNSANVDLYVNGVKIETTVVDADTVNLQGTTLCIGGRDATTDLWHGSIANFHLFNRALTSDEIYQLYAYQKEYFGHGNLGMTLKAGRLGIGTSEPRAVLDVEGDTFSRKYNGGRSTFLTWDYLGSRSTSIVSGMYLTGGKEGTILDHEFDVPTCYHDLDTATLKAYVNIDWRGECQIPWNFVFKIKVYYNDYSSTYTLDCSLPDQAADNRARGCGLPTISYSTDDFSSTLEHASVSSQFTLEGCKCTSGSKIKVELIGINTTNGDVTIWTGRTKTATNRADYEMVISSFFVALDVV